jgi:hypothetical protein
MSDTPEHEGALDHKPAVDNHLIRLFADHLKKAGLKIEVRPRPSDGGEIVSVLMGVNGVSTPFFAYINGGCLILTAEGLTEPIGKDPDRWFDAMTVSSQANTIQKTAPEVRMARLIIHHDTLECLAISVITDESAELVFENIMTDFVLTLREAQRLLKEIPA